MLFARLKPQIRAFYEDARGVIAVESVFWIPTLFLGLILTYEFFEIHRYASAREKATYTVADMISRENAFGDDDVGLTDAYLNNALQLFNEISNDDGDNTIRVSMIRFVDPTPADDTNDDGEYNILWSEVRGTGSFTPYTTAEIRLVENTLPFLENGEDLILVESQSVYDATFDIFAHLITRSDEPPIDEDYTGRGLDGKNIRTRSFTAIRFAPQICYESDCAIDS